jgi:hypothetical protein
MEVNGQRHAPAALPLGEIQRYPLDRRLGGSQNRFGHCGEGKSLLPPPGLEPWLSSSLPFAIPNELSRFKTLNYHTNINFYWFQQTTISLVRFPTLAAEFRSQVSSCEICGGQNGTETNFLRALWFCLPILIPLIVSYSLLILLPILILHADSVVTQRNKVSLVQYIDFCTGSKSAAKYFNSFSA